MNRLQKIILVSLVSISAFSWFLATNQPDMMNIMITYNPILLALFTASWTAGMAAMMFPAIVPMVLLYYKLTTNEQLFATNICRKVEVKAESMNCSEYCKLTF